MLSDAAIRGLKKGPKPTKHPDSRNLYLLVHLVPSQRKAVSLLEYLQEAAVASERSNCCLNGSNRYRHSHSFGICLCERQTSNRNWLRTIEPEVDRDPIMTLNFGLMHNREPAPDGSARSTPHRRGVMPRGGLAPIRTIAMGSC